jgi:hypothetical protein
VLLNVKWKEMHGPLPYVAMCWVTKFAKVKHKKLFGIILCHLLIYQTSLYSLTTESDNINLNPYININRDTTLASFMELNHIILLKIT